MGRILLTISVFLLSFAIPSCSGGLEEPNGYSVRSDVDSISGISSGGRSAAVEGNDIIGVLLVFDGKNEFYIEYLNGDVRENGDGMKYNYILHIPSDIAAVYRSANGYNPNSGNPFWWYMSVYFDRSMSNIVNNYDNVLGMLLDSRGELLPVARAEDVAGKWDADGYYDDSQQEPVEIPENTILLVDPDSSTTFDDLYVGIQSVGPFVTLEGYGDMIRRGFYISPNGKLYFPNELVDVYVEYMRQKDSSFEYNGNGDPLWKYTSTYFDLDLDDLRGNLSDLLEVLREKDELPYPNEEDYVEADSRPEEPVDISSFSAFFDKEYEYLKLDAAITEFPEKIGSLNLSSQLKSDDARDPDSFEYCWSTFTITDTPKLYFPVALIKVYQDYTGDYSDSGDPFWTYMECYYPDSELYDTDHVREIGFDQVLEFVVEHKDSLPYPTVEDYVEKLGSRW